MIGKASTAASFGALARYLEAGRRGTEFERVAWREARNLPTDDPRLAAGNWYVGCAVKQGPEWDYLVCRYSPAGNLVGARTY